MKDEWITCSMCGHTFNPQLHGACQACPLQKGCSLVCCPACGFELVDVQKSRLAKWVARWLFPGRTQTHSNPTQLQKPSQ